MSYAHAAPRPFYPYSTGFKMAALDSEKEYTITAPVKKDDDAVEKQGLWQFKAMLSLWLWYFFSTCTLFLNKHILVTMKGEPTLLSE
jgi:hypothetical protein